MHILAPHISCICNTAELQQAVNDGYKEIYIMTVNGTFKHHILRGENRFVRIKVDKIPGYTEPKIEEGINFLPAGKVPYEIYEQVLAFFKKVMEVKTSEVEAMIHILYNAERGYHLGVPPQTVSKASASYDWNYIPAGTSVIVDIHSHNTMGAFFSGTDDRDDRGNISFSGVFGKLKDREPMTIWRFNYFDKKFTADVDDLFEAPARPAVEVPQDWIDQVNTPVYTTNYRGGQSNLGNVGRPVGVPVVGQTSGRTPEELGKWRYPTTTTTPQKGGAAGNQSNQNPSPSGTARPTGLSFDDCDADDSLYHFFGTELPHDYPVAVTSRGIIIPTDSNHAGDDEEGPEFTYYDPKDGVMKEGTREEADPNFGVTSLLEDNSHLEGESDPVGKSSGMAALSEEASGSIDEYTDPQYEIIKSIHGDEVADAWHSIQTEMSLLNGQDELNQELICDMAGLTTEEGQMKIMKALFERLSPKNREAIETHGL